MTIATEPRTSHPRIRNSSRSAHGRPTAIHGGPKVPDSASTSTPLTPHEESVAERVRREIDRTIQRQVKGLEYISTAAPAVGLTPKDTIWSRGTLRLYHYRCQTDEVYRIPVLFIMSLVSKPYILDLVPGQSLIEYLVQQGFDVYLVDWGIPQPEDKRLTLEDYVLDFIPGCIARVQEDSGERDISLVGYCMGGLLSLLYGALHPRGPLSNLAAFTTPVNYDGMGLHRTWSDPRWFDVDRVVDTLGNVPPEIIFGAFELLRPASKPFSRMRLWDNMWNDEFTRSFRLMDRWGADQIPFPGETFRQTIKELMWGNKLVKGTLELAGRRVDLRRITVPVLHVTAEYDHIVPADASRDLVRLVGAEDKQEIVMKGGHVSLVAGGNALFRLWPQLDRWLASRSV